MFSQLFFLATIMVGITTASPTETASTSWSLITPAPATTLEKRDCYVQTLYGGQAPIYKTICPSAPKCSVCIGCNAPVTRCS